MKHTLLALFALLGGLTASAYDFMADNIAYNLNSDGNSVTVTYTKYGNNYPGVPSIVVPQSVFHNGKQYTVTAIGEYAFYECEALMTLSIPISVKTVDDYAAFGCELLSSLSIGSNVASIGQYAFSETALVAVELPLSVTTLGNYAFAGCTQLKQLNSGNGLKQIGRSAFNGCTALATATLGVKVSTIGTNAFGGCSALATLNANMPDPSKVTVSDNSFDASTKATCRLCVPRGTLDAYANAPVWQDFVHISDVSQGYSLQLEFNQAGLLRNESATLEIGLANEDEVTALQCDIVLPPGLELTMTNGDYDIDINEDRRGRDHGLTVNKTGTDTYTLLLSSPSGKAFKGNTGTLLTLHLGTAAMATGYYTVYARNASVAKPSSEMLYLNDESLQINIVRSYLLGDANGDGTVDVADYVVTANKLVGKSVVAFYSDAADVNQNGGIDLGDLVGITQRALGKITPEVITVNN